MIERLRKITSGLIKLNKNSENEEKYLLIEKILKDEKCFFKMDIETSFSILRDLQIKEEDISKIYKELIDPRYYN